MHLGLFLNGVGHHIAAWRDPSVRPSHMLAVRFYADIARLAERGRFDMLFLADSNATFGPDDPAVWSRTGAALRLEPVTLLSALSMVTEHIGLVSTATTTYSQPFSVARMFASLDHISGGRAGWNVVTSSATAEAYNFSHAAHPPHADRYVRAAEFIEVVQGLWDSWDDDALLYDQESGRMFDPAKLHFLDHQGPSFSVRGPLSLPRSPQGQPVIVEAGQSEAGRDLAARTADVVFAVQQDIDEAIRLRTDFRARAARAGRSPDAIRVMPGVLPVIGATQDEADAKLAAMQALIHPDIGVKTLSDLVGKDLSEFPLDGPVPDVPVTNTQQGRQRVVLDLARREGLSIRQLYLRVTGARAHRIIAGTPARIADELELWVREGAADGFNIMPLTFPDGLRDFVDDVIPLLQARGSFRRDYAGTTLRDNLGLPIPPHRHAARASEAAI